MASNALWVVAACFNEVTVIPRFIEQVIALPAVDRPLLIDDGSSDATVLLPEGDQGMAYITSERGR